MAQAPTTSPDSSTLGTNVVTGLRGLGVTLFSIFWLLAYVLLLVGGYLDNIHWRAEFPALAKTELHPLRIALNETMSVLPLLVLEPWFGTRLGSKVDMNAKQFWRLAFLLAFLAAIIESIWMLFLNLTQIFATKDLTGNDSSYGLAFLAIFVTTFIITSIVHCLLGAVLRRQWRRRAA